MDSSKNRSWIIPFKKFSRLRVKIISLIITGCSKEEGVIFWCYQRDLVCDEESLWQCEGRLCTTIFYEGEFKQKKIPLSLQIIFMTPPPPLEGVGI